MLMLAARSGKPAGNQLLLEAGDERNARKRSRHDGVDVGDRAEAPRGREVLLAGGAIISAKSGGARTPAKLHGESVNLRAVQLAQDRRRRAAAGVNYDEQL